MTWTDLTGGKGEGKHEGRYGDRRTEWLQEEEALEEENEIKIEREVKEGKEGRKCQ